jgi:hypothetical protein
MIYDISPARCGTTSLYQAMLVLGNYRAIKGYPPGTEQTTLNHLEYGFLDMPWEKDYDFIGGMFNFDWHNLVRTKPDARFILLTRNINDWIDSTLVKLREYSPSSKSDPISYFHRIANLGCVHTTDRNRLRRYYELHSLAIAGYFEDAPAAKFLQMDIKDGWEPLCEWLGEPIPTVPFPHLNKGNPL